MMTGIRLKSMLSVRSFSFTLTTSGIFPLYVELADTLKEIHNKLDRPKLNNVIIPLLIRTINK